jgi:hypothetical protein
MIQKNTTRCNRIKFKNANNIDIQRCSDFSKVGSMARGIQREYVSCLVTHSHDKNVTQ